MNGTQEPIFYSFALSSPLGHKIFKETRIKLYIKIIISVLLQITIYLAEMMITNQYILKDKRIVSLAN